MSRRLDGRAAVITGGADGIGRAAVERFVAEGARVVVMDVQEDKGAAVAARFAGAVEFVPGDIRSEAAFAAAVEVAEDRFGGLDVMYHNAGSPGSRRGFEDMDVDEWDDTFAIQVRSAMLAITCSIPALRRRSGGSIILTSSGVAYQPRADGLAAYAVAKGAVASLGRVAALKLADERIRVNVLVPGAVATPSHAKSTGYSQELADAMTPHLRDLVFSGYQPFPMAGTPEDIAAAAVFLASDDARWVTGIALPVDGGFTIQHRIDPAAMADALVEAERRARAEM